MGDLIGACENRNGILYFDGCDTTELAKEYGTPLFLMSETEIVRRMAELRRTFIDRYPKCRVAYAAKAFCTVAMMKICAREGFCVDVVSGGELFIAKTAGFPAERIEFNGNNKTRQEIEEAVDYGVGRFIVDGLTELSIIEDVCRQKEKRTNILFRVTPGVAADSHDYIVTGKKDSKFGIPLDEDIFLPQVEHAIDSDVIDFLGLHFHVGSQLFDVSPYLQALDIILEQVAKIRERFGYVVQELNLGGGFGVRYVAEERKPYEYFLDPMVKRIHEFYGKLGEDIPSIVIEPGRSIVAEAGVNLYTVGQIKDIPGLRKFIAVDGGMSDNIRPPMYKADYSGAIANKMDEPAWDVVTVCGKCCESGDLLIKNGKFAKAEAGDILAMYSTGAYGYSMASNYNSNPIPAVVLCREGKYSLIVRRQSYEQLVANQLDI